jgi:hypothetical protein
MEAEVDTENSAQCSFRDKLLSKIFGPYTGSQIIEIELDCPPMVENTCTGALVRNGYELQIKVYVGKKSFTISLEVQIYGFPLVNRIERDCLFHWDPEEGKKYEPLIFEISPEASEEVFFGNMNIKNAFSPTLTKRVSAFSVERIGTKDF